MRGERACLFSVAKKPHGLSPHARGTLSGYLPGREWIRIIPACAGNATGNLKLLPRTTDYPRMRGERGPGPLGFRGPGGLSPHARGTRAQ